PANVEAPEEQDQDQEPRRRQHRRRRLQHLIPVKQRYRDQAEHRAGADERDRGLEEARSLLEELQQQENQSEVGDQLDREQDDVGLGRRDDRERNAADDRIDDQHETEQELRRRQILRAAAMQGDIDE